MRKVFIIGIGAGNPDYITVQAINALNAVDVFFVMEKGRETEDLVRLHKEICERHIKDKSYRRTTHAQRSTRGIRSHSHWEESSRQQVDKDLLAFGEPELKASWAMR